MKTSNFFRKRKSIHEKHCCLFYSADTHRVMFGFSGARTHKILAIYAVNIVWIEWVSILHDPGFSGSSGHIHSIDNIQVGYEGITHMDHLNLKYLSKNQ